MKITKKLILNNFSFCFSKLNIKILYLFGDIFNIDPRVINIIFYIHLKIFYNISQYSVIDINLWTFLVCKVSSAIIKNFEIFKTSIHSNFPIFHFIIFFIYYGIKIKSTNGLYSFRISHQRLLGLNRMKR